MRRVLQCVVAAIVAVTLVCACTTSEVSKTRVINSGKVKLESVTVYVTPEEAQRLLSASQTKR